jgi:hypothetical protein
MIKPPFSLFSGQERVHVFDAKIPDLAAAFFPRGYASKSILFVKLDHLFIPLKSGHNIIHVRFCLAGKNQSPSDKFYAGFVFRAN